MLAEAGGADKNCFEDDFEAIERHIQAKNVPTKTKA
jgi:hypothetical protein